MSMAEGSGRGVQKEMPIKLQEDGKDVLEREFGWSAGYGGRSNSVERGVRAGRAAGKGRRAWYCTSKGKRVG